MWPCLKKTPWTRGRKPPKPTLIPSYVFCSSGNRFPRLCLMTSQPYFRPSTQLPLTTWHNLLTSLQSTQGQTGKEVKPTVERKVQRWAIVPAILRQRVLCLLETASWGLPPLPRWNVITHDIFDKHCYSFADAYHFQCFQDPCMLE